MPEWLAQLLTVLAYAACTRLAIFLVGLDPNTAAVWFPAGFAVANTLLFGPQRGIAIFVGGLLGNWGESSPLLPSLIIAFGNAFEAVVAALLARQVLGFDTALNRSRDAISLALPIALFPSLASALLGTYALMQTGAVKSTEALSHTGVWWLGDALGVIVVTPLLLLWHRRSDLLTWSDLIVLLPIGVALLTFAAPPGAGWAHRPFEFAILALAVWCALQASQRSLALASFIIASIVLLGTSLERGPFVDANSVVSNFEQQVYVFALSLILLVIGAARVQQRNAEAQVQASGDLFRSVWETAPDAAFVLDHHGVIRYANPGASEMTGYANAELVGEPISLIQPERLRHAHQTGMDRYLQSGEKRIDWRATETLVLDRAGTEIPVEIVFSEARIEGERGFVGFMRDISRRKAADAEIRRSQKLFMSIFQESPATIVITRLQDGRIFEVNEATHKMFGYRRDELIGKTTADLGAWVESGLRNRLIEQIRRDGRIDNLDAQLRHRDGHVLDVLYFAQIADFAGEPCIIATVVDVTARKRAEAQQRLADERLSQVFHSCPDAIILSRLSDGTYLDVNDAWVEFCGHPKEAMVGRSSLDLGVWANPDERAQLLEHLKTQRRIRNFEFHMRRANGDEAIALLSGEIITVGGEECLLSVLSDITDRKRAEAQLRASERRFADVVEAAGEFIWESDINARLTYLSDRVERVLGYLPTELIGRTPTHYMPPEEIERVRHWFASREDRHSAFSGLEHIAVTKAGARIWLQIAAVPVFDDTGAHVGYRGTGLDITERKLAQARVEELATRDSLTQLPNRRLLMDRLSQGLLTAQRNGSVLAVLFIDLDRFKTINDSLGHAVGDQLLVDVSQRLSGLMRRGDTLARLGGDEFVVVLSELRLSEDAGVVAAKMIAALSAPFQIDHHSLNTSASIGISIYPHDANDAPTMIRNADMAMYAAKEAGRHSYQFFSAEMNARALERHALENALRGAIAAKQFVLHYHPKFCLRSGKLEGVEVLVRWSHPTLGIIPPERFISIAEDTGLIVELGSWVLHEAARQAAKWDALVPEKATITYAVNLSVAQLNKTLVVLVDDVINQSGIDPRRFELEITESMLMKNVDENVAVLRQLEALGVLIAIDDFGTGYSSLAYLRRIGADILKIDRSFVRDVDTNLDDAAIVEAIIALGRTLGLSVVAEGVETEAQRQALALFGCDYVQGYLYCEPLPAEEFARRYLLSPNS